MTLASAGQMAPQRDQGPVTPLSLAEQALGEGNRNSQCQRLLSLAEQALGEGNRSSQCQRLLSLAEQALGEGNRSSQCQRLLSLAEQALGEGNRNSQCQRLPFNDDAPKGSHLKDSAQAAAEGPAPRRRNEAPDTWLTYTPSSQAYDHRYKLVPNVALSLLLRCSHRMFLGLVGQLNPTLSTG